jgi:hypothetical protein
LIVITSNSPPSIATISDETVMRNGSITAPFTIGDAETPVDLLTLSASSSNTNLVPRANINLSGTGADRSISLIAASNQLGGATIAISVSDGVLSTTTSFTLTVVGTNNRPTSVQFTSPANNAVFSAPASIPMAAVANDPDGNIMRVDYWLENAIIGSATTAPYSLTLNDVPLGTYALRAIATDEGGLSATSAVRQIFVRNAPAVLVPAGAVWKFYDVNGVDLGTAWRETNYNDFAWASGPAKLGFGDAATTPVNSDPTRVTTYFRNRFVVTNASLITGLTIGLIRDDGAVVYLNGTEVFRSNMPGGVITNGSIASSAISGVEETTWFTNRTASPSLLRSGTNVLAVEVHQGSASSSDLGFNLLLAGDIGATSVSPIPLSAARGSNSLVLSWPANTGWNLYSASTLGPGTVWTRVGGGPITTNGQTTFSLATTQSSTFLQLRRP